MKRYSEKFMHGALAVVLTVIILPLSCTEKENGFASSRHSSYDITARFLAGKDIGDVPELSEFTKTSFYKNYSANVRSGWKRFQKPNLEKMLEWWKKHKPNNYEKTVFYPFSGPDIMNALTFFPEGDLYIMFGLEKPGNLPDPREMTTGQLKAGLTGVQNSLNTIFRVNFFRTKGMAANLGNSSFSSISGLIMFFLSTNGYEITDYRRIAVDSSSSVVPGKRSDLNIDWKNPPTARIPGVEISFRKDGGKIRKVRYYMLNVIDYALTKHSPNFLPYLKKEGPFTTVIKSASYLMHNDKVKFTRIRGAVLDNSEFIVQDDSGIPLRYFPRENWKLRFHGVYNYPIPLFRHRTQNDLRAAMKKHSTGVLPFSYGYDHIKNQSNLMTAKKVR